MSETQTNVFISYSRTDSTFIDRLEDDLRAKNFYTWVDRRKIEGGQDWSKVIEKTIGQCQVLLVVLSPTAVASPNVDEECEIATRLDKPIIPLEHLPVKLAPWGLNRKHWIKFASSYDQGLEDLLITFNRIEPKAVRVPEAVSVLEKPPLILPPRKKAPKPVSSKPAPPLPSPELTSLYQEGLEAIAEKNLERATTLWQQILDRDPQFLDGTLAIEMKKLAREWNDTRVRFLRKQADEAHNLGEWGQEIDAWKALLGIEPKDA